MPAFTKDEIFEKVQQTLVDALSVDDDEVTNEASLTGDLGAESIDFLDIIFRLEKEFGIKISQDELIPKELLSNEDYVNEKKLNAAGLEALKSSMPYADLTSFGEDPDIDRLSEVFTVETMVNFVQHKLDAA